MHEYIDPPIGLCEKIIGRIHKERRILVLKRTILFSVTFAGSVFSVIVLVTFLPPPDFLAKESEKSGAALYSDVAEANNTPDKTPLYSGTRGPQTIFLSSSVPFR